MYSHAHAGGRARSHSQQWLIARWWKIMCDLTGWWICFCFGHPSMNTDICNRANTHAHTHSHTHAKKYAHRYTHIHAQGYQWQVTDRQWHQPLCETQTWEMIHLIEVLKSTQQRCACVFTCTHKAVHVSGRASMRTNVGLRTHVSASVCVCVK